MLVRADLVQYSLASSKQLLKYLIHNISKITHGLNILAQYGILEIAEIKIKV